MESSTLENTGYLSGVICVTCNMPHGLDENGECEFCRNSRAARLNKIDARFSERIVLAIVIAGVFFVGLVYELIVAVIQYWSIP